MKKFLIFALATMAAVPAMSQSFADKLMRNYRVDFDDAILLGGLARDFGLDDSVVFDMRDRYGYNDNDLLSALTLQRRSRRSSDDIYQMRRDGMGWGQIAHAIGMHPGDFNKARKAGKFGTDRDMYDDMWRDRFDRKGTRSSDIDWARNKGVNYRDVYVADVLARSRGRSFQDAITTYKRTNSWDRDRPILLGGQPRYETLSRSTIKAKSANTKAKSNAKKKVNKANTKNKGKGGGNAVGNNGQKNKAKKSNGKGNGRGFADNKG